jgi:hypothetical protein
LNFTYRLVRRRDIAEELTHEAFIAEKGGFFAAQTAAPHAFCTDNFLTLQVHSCFNLALGTPPGI